MAEDSYRRFVTTGPDPNNPRGQRVVDAMLQRNEIKFFYFHPTFDDNGGILVFAYCRTAGNPVGSPGQVVVVANMCSQTFPAFTFPKLAVGRLCAHGNRCRRDLAACVACVRWVHRGSGRVPVTRVPDLSGFPIGSAGVTYRGANTFSSHRDPSSGA